MSDELSGNATRQSEKTSWNTHYLLTRAALSSMEGEVLSAEVTVRSLDDFVAAASAELPAVMKRYAALLAKKTGTASNPETDLCEISTARDLIAALRLNPHRTFPYSRVVAPEDDPTDAPHDPSREGPPAGRYIDAVIGDRMSVPDVLCVYADEPDWGMDQDVFVIEPYGLGRPPLGGESGKSSQASFHMAFFHEMPLVEKLVPRVKRTFLDVRVRVFMALARLALDKQVDYWAWRFTAWAAHYLQDLTQPYHAKLLPFPFWSLLWRFLRDLRPAGFAERNKNLLMNRHILCEAVVHLWLNEATKKRIEHPFLTALKGQGDCAEGSLKEVLQESAKIAADRAFRVNRDLELILDDPLLNDATYFVLSGPPYPLLERLKVAAVERPQIVQELKDLLSACLVQTGRVTRYMIREVSRQG